MIGAMFKPLAVFWVAPSAVTQVPPVILQRAPTLGLTWAREMIMR
ncbi:unannotated protein [freshwater metagenome]|uniref:Unannotated protein n=1 Tax=freshwater metagenome TaxID=449393 RepID=A0A6J7LE62_9ZZZZ